jgi:putative ABC transport system substrate-binding protein
MAAIADPLGIVGGLAQPGGNVTGLSAFSSELEAKRVELIRDVVPSLRGIGALYNMGNPIFALRFKELEKVAELLRIEAHLLDVRKSEDLAAAFDTASKRRVDALIVSADGILQANRKRTAELAVIHRLPAIYTSRERMRAGGATLAEIGKQLGICA